jgi:subtilisin family serine protease
MRDRCLRAAIAALGVLVVSALGAGSALATPRQDTPALPRIVVGFANPAYTPPSAPGATGTRYGGDGYRVSQGAQQQVRGVAATYALREVVSWPIRALALHCVVFEVTDGRPLTEVLAALAKDRRVRLAQPMNEFRTLSADAAPAAAPYNDPLYDLQTNLTALDIARAHQRTQGAGVRIALIDTGVDASHPDLTGRIVRTESFIGARPPSGRLRHGTAMAGLIAAVANNHVGIVGIAPLARLEVFEACWQLTDGSDAAACNTFTLAKALAAALASGASLVNLSIGGPADPLLTALIEHGLGRGVTFVGALPAGREAPGEADGGFPTGIPGVIRAGGSEQPLSRDVLAAPAEHVLTLRPGAQYDFESGSSVAAAEITGVLALLLSASTTRLSPATLASLLGDGPLPVAVARTDSASAGRPVVDASAALGRLDALQSPRTKTETAAP